MPEPVRAAWEEMTRQDVEALIDGGAEADDPVRRATIGHAVAFSTWRSPCREQGLTDRDAVEVMVTLAEAVGAKS